MSIHNSYWKQEHFDKVESARKYETLAEVGLSILASMPGLAIQVCGPMTSGGKGNHQENIRVVETVMRRRANQGYTVFNQLPFGPAMGRILQARIADGKSKMERELELLESVYFPLFRSKRIGQLHFVHGWDSSQGARWEYDLGSKLGITRVCLARDFLGEDI